MNNLKNNKLLICIILYVTISFILFIMKPSFMFRQNEMIPFGLQQNETIFSYPVVLVIMAIVLYFACQFIMN